LSKPVDDPGLQKHTFLGVKKLDISIIQKRVALFVDAVNVFIEQIDVIPTVFQLIAFNSGVYFRIADNGTIITERNIVER
jgi:hypothetical protein